MELLEDRAELDAILREGSARASAVATETLAAVYDRIGFVPAGPSAASPSTAGQ